MKTKLFLILAFYSALSCTTQADKEKGNEIYNKRNAENYYINGTKHYYNGDYLKAEMDFHNALNINPNDAKLNYYMGLVKDISDESTRSKQWAKGVVNGTKAELYIGEAIKFFNRAIEIDSAFLDAHFQRADIRKTLQDYRGAIDDYNKMIEIDSTNIDAFCGRGQVKENYLNDKRGALEDFSLAIKIAPEDAQAYFQRSELMYDMKDYRRAIADYNKIIEICSKPDSHCVSDQTYYNRGLAKIMLAQVDGGCLDLRKASELGVNDAYQAIIDYCN